MNRDLPVSQPASNPHRGAPALFGVPDAGELERSRDAGEEVGPDSGGLNCQCESAHHVVAGFVLRSPGFCGADTAGEGGLFGHGRGSLLGPCG